MKNLVRTVLCLLVFGTAHAGIITAGLYADDTAFSTATGAVSLTGALPDIGNQGTSVTLGNATLTAGNTLYVGSGWSSLMPGGNAIAISGPENVDISIDTGLATAYGLYFHEPIASTAQLDGCNVPVCVESTFEISFYLAGGLIDQLMYSPGNDQLLFLGIILDEVFDEVRFTETIGTNDNEFFGEMYIARAVVSEPATLLLFGIVALFGIRLTGRRR